jgi:hypothetical protein
LKKLCLTLICFGFCFYYAAAQDTHYWAQEYNPAGFLTPGAAVALTRDSGVLYFNPALLAFNTKNSASISGSVYQFNSARIKNGVGTGYPLKSTNVSIIPVVASGVIAVKGGKKFTIGYAIIHNPVVDFHSTQQRDDKFNVLNDDYSPGNEEFIGQYSIQNTVTETAGLLSGGFKVSSRLSLGFSAQTQLRSQHYAQNYSARAFVNTTTNNGLPPIVNDQEEFQVSHYNAGMNFKAGLAYDFLRHHLGLTVTSPLVKLKSNGEILSDDIVTDLRLTPTDTINLLASSRQTKLKENWKMPLSIAGGYAYDTNWGQIYVSAEYFSRISEYNIITPRNDYFIRGDGGGSQSFTSSLLKVKDARKAVTNFGLGVSFILTPEVTGYVSGRTDFSYADKNLFADDDGHTVNTAYYNNYHGQIGANLKRRKFNLRMGLLLTYGHTTQYMQPYNFNTPHESNFLNGETVNSPATNFVVGLMFAYIHNL